MFLICGIISSIPKCLKASEETQRITIHVAVSVAISENAHTGEQSYRIQVQKHSEKGNIWLLTRPLRKWPDMMEVIIITTS